VRCPLCGVRVWTGLGVGLHLREHVLEVAAHPELIETEWRNGPAPPAPGPDDDEDE